MFFFGSEKRVGIVRRQNEEVSSYDAAGWCWSTGVARADILSEYGEGMICIAFRGEHGKNEVNFKGLVFYYYII